MGVPSGIIASAIVSGLSLFVLTMVVFRVPARKLSGMQRLYIVWLCGAALWVLLLFRCPELAPPSRQAWWDVSCGALTFISFVWCNYWFANLGGGFRVLMLLDLAEAKGPVSVQEWMDLYGRGCGMHAFLEDRLRSVLLPMKIVSREGDVVQLTPGLGAVFARGASVLRLVLVGRTWHA